MVKTLYLIRHGEALHNVMFNKMGAKAFRSPLVIDAPLTQTGQEQSIRLGYQWKEKLNIELVLVSPLMRTLETAMNIFGDTEIKIEAQDFLREYPIGEDTCNKRSDRSHYKKKFPNIDFSDIVEDKDIEWTNERETMESLEDRIYQLKQYVNNRSEENIAIVGHSSYIGKVKDNYISYIENGDKELLHCHPYEYIVETKGTDKKGG